MNMQLSHNEYQIMDLLWREQRPLSRNEILEGTEGRDWNPASVHLILNSMLSKGVLKVTDLEKKYGRTYEAVISHEDYLAQYIVDGTPGRTQKDRLLSVVSALVNKKGIDKETIDELEKLLEEKKKEI